LPNKDSFGKRIFESETKTVTAGAALYDPNAKTPIYSAEPDGLLIVKTAKQRKQLSKLPPPWSLFAGEEVTLELKMQGDPTDKEALQRALLQRAARSFSRNTKNKNFDHENGMWIVAPNLPGWLSQYTDIEDAGPGCYRLWLGVFDSYWIASNELPEREELIPFLVTRWGKPLERFVRWVASRRTPDWVKLLMKELKMNDTFVTDMLKTLPPQKDPQLIRQGEIITRDYLENHPRVKAELVEVGRVEELRVLFAKKLGTNLTKEQDQSFDQLMLSLGREKLQDLLLEKTKVELYTLLTPAPKTTKKTVAKKPTKTKK
jgi:hypothetical protein